MVSKLTFKGDKPTRKKAHKHSKHKEKSHSSTNQAQNAVGWVSAERPEDLKGPAVISFTTSSDPTTAHCICSDSDGNVYIANNLDVLSESSEILDTVEPNNVQQVFVLNALAGHDKPVANDDLSVSIKAFTNKYLTIDKHGLVDAMSIAIGPYQVFKVILRPSGCWIIAGSNDMYLFVDENEKSTKGYIIRGDAASADDATEFVFRIQAQNKVEQKSADLMLMNSQHISSRDLEAKVGRPLSSQEKKRLKTAYKEGKLNEALLDLRQRTKTDTRC